MRRLNEIEAERERKKELSSNVSTKPRLRAHVQRETNRERKHAQWNLSFTSLL